MMNINDVRIEDLGITGEDRLDQIFKRQLELMQKYHPIEDSIIPVVTSEVPVNLHDAKGQFRLKDFAWRITEELGEALEALVIHNSLTEHYDEEISDAFHFLVEFTILAGSNPEEIVISSVDYLKPKEDKLEALFWWWDIQPKRDYDSLAEAVGKFVEMLATTCNCLKNKPWKQTQMMTDVLYFKTRLKLTWRYFIRLCVLSGMTSEDLLTLYFKKSEVNKFRQRSNY